MKVLKIIYSVFIAFIILVALLLIVSVFPITGNIKFLTVQSGSMEPTVKMGGVVLVKPVDDYQIGDIITFGKMTKTKSPITHRIYDMKVVEGDIRYITKGDANEDPDQREVLKGEIVGKVLLSVPYAGYAVDFAKKPLGFAFIILVPAAVIISDEIKKIYGEIKRKKNKNE